MQRSRNWSERPTYMARFEDGPRDATSTFVLALDSGEPPDLLLTPGQRGWVYVLAGGARKDGSLPYLWMPKEKVVALLEQGPDSPTT